MAVVLAIVARRAPELPPELAREVALIGKAARQRDLGQRGLRVHQRAACQAQSQLAEKFLRGEMKRGAEPAFERPHRHIRNRREALIADLTSEIRAHVRQRGPEAWPETRTGQIEAA